MMLFFGKRHAVDYTPMAIAKAGVFTGFFLLLAVIRLCYVGPRSEFFLPEGIVFAFILLNSYFSVRLFSSLTRRGDYAQWSFDALLVALYTLMVVHLGHPTLFPAWTAAMFLVATAKYAVLSLHHHEYRLLFRHKMIIDLLGFSFAALAGLWSLAGEPDVALHLWAILFSLAQLDIFIRKPLYVAR